MRKEKIMKITIERTDDVVDVYNGGTYDGYEWNENIFAVVKKGKWEKYYPLANVIMICMEESNI